MNKSFRNIFLALLLSASSLMTFADDEIGTVFITGANRGIGLEFTKQYLERGWSVIATARKPEKAEDLKQFIRKRTNEKLVELGYAGIFKYDEEKAKNLDWFYHLTGGHTHTDFFAIRPTDYSKANEGEDFENIW